MAAWCAILHCVRLGLRVCSKHSGRMYSLLKIAVIATHLHSIQSEVQGLPLYHQACLLPDCLLSGPSLGSHLSQIVRHLRLLEGCQLGIGTGCMDCVSSLFLGSWEMQACLGNIAGSVADHCSTSNNHNTMSHTIIFDFPLYMSYVYTVL